MGKRVVEVFLDPYEAGWLDPDKLIGQVRRLADELGWPGIVGKRGQTNDEFWRTGQLNVVFPSRRLARQFQRDVQDFWGNVAMTRRIRPRAA